MRTVAVVNLKGGVGKSTTAINMALIMSQAHGKNVLLIDNDFQAAVTKFFGKHSYDKPSMEDVLRNPMLSAEEVIIPSGRWGLDIIPANMNMIAAADDLITDKDSDQIGRIRNILNQVEEEYDYCIIDCHPSVGIEVLNALAAAEDIIIPVDQHIIIWHFRRIKLCRNNAGIFHPRTPGILVITVIEKIITVITRLKMGYFNFPDSANYGIK